MNETSSTPAVRPTTDEESIVQEISILLRDGRLDLGESVEQVASTLRINRRYIEAIEDGRFNDLPGSVYAIGFIRTFGDHVGLDGEELVRRFKEASSSTKKPSNLEFPEPIPESGVPGGAVLFAGILVAAVAYGGWYMMTEEDNILSDLVAPVPEELAEKTQVADALATVDDDAVLSVTEESTVSVDEESNDITTDGADIVEQAETELEAAIEPVSEEIEEPPLTDASTDVGDTPVEPETVETVAESAEQVETAATESVEQVEETVEETSDAVTTEAEQATDDVEQTAQVVESAVETISEEVESAIEPEIAPEAEPASDAETSSQQAAADLNAEQLQALQAGMIDAPAPEVVSTAAVNEETESEPVDESVEESVSESVTETETETTEEPVEEPSAETAAVSETEELEAEPATEAETASIPADDAVPNQVVIVAKEDSWVEIRDNGIDSVLVSRVMKTGERYEVPVGGAFELQTGNIGALEFIVGGETLSAIGEDGEIGRNISLSPSSLISRQGATGR